MATGQAVLSRPSRELGACCPPLRLAHTNLQPCRRQDPRVPLTKVSARRMTIQAEGNGFLFVFKHKGKSLLSLIRCHLNERTVRSPPSPHSPDSLQGGIEASVYSGLSVASLSSPSSPGAQPPCLSRTLSSDPVPCCPAGSQPCPCCSSGSCLCGVLGEPWSWSPSGTWGPDRRQIFEDFFAPDFCFTY